MSWEGWVTVAAVAAMAVAMLRSWAGPDTVLLGGVAVFMTLGVWAPHDPATGAVGFPSPAVMVAGFGNPGIATIAVLFVVAAGLSRTGAMGMVSAPLLGRPASAARGQARLMVSVATLSAFVNNTPVVAMCVPLVADWCRKAQVAPSRLLIPLSYAAVLGGTCTLVGTATNIYIHGWLEEADRARFGMFTLAWVGVPAAVTGLVYLLVAGRWVLPDRGGVVAEMAEDLRRYTVQMKVEPDGPVAGRSIADAGLRQLSGAFLVQVERDGEQMVAVGPEQVLHGGDHLMFVGVAEAMGELQQVRGLVPATEQVFKIADPRSDRVLVEAVVSDRCPLVGQSIRDGRFRTRYDAVVLAVRRGGEHMRSKVGDIVLRPGDTLLIEGHARFLDRHGDREDFYLTSPVRGGQVPRYSRAAAAAGLLVAMVAVVAVGWVPLLNAALLAAGGMVLAGCCTPAEARRAINWRLLLMLGAAIGVGQTLATTGAADAIAGLILQVAERGGPVGVLAGIYLVTMLFNMMVGHAAAAALCFPIASAAAAGLGVDIVPFAVVLMMAASADFANPVSYPTHLMVYGAGGYRVSDFVRAGLPLNLIVMAVTLAVVPWVFPLVPG